MELDNGRAWKDLVVHGILARRMLPYLWVGEDVVYLELLLQKLGLFAPIDGERYLVPLTVCSVVNANAMPWTEFPSTFLESNEIDEETFDFCSFQPNGFFEHVVVLLVSTKGVAGHPP